MGRSSSSVRPERARLMNWSRARNNFHHGAPQLGVLVFGGAMSLLAFFSRMGESSWSTSLHESQYAYSIIESLHVWTLAVFFGSIIMVDLRLLGLTMRKVPVTEVAGRLLPWTVGA